MKHQCINELHRFDLQDRYWSAVSLTGEELRLYIKEDFGIWEFEGKPITNVHVTFRGFRMNWAKAFPEAEAQELTLTEAMDRISAEPLFVFSYSPLDGGCEICGMRSDGPLAMNFSFDGTLAEWEDDEGASEGILTKL